MDDFIHQLLVEETVCEVALPHLPRRWKLEQSKVLPARISILEEED